MVVGDGKGRVGFGTGKAKEVPEAIRKATDDAKRNMVRVPLRDGRTLHHDIKGFYGAGHVILRQRQLAQVSLPVVQCVQFLRHLVCRMLCQSRWYFKPA